MKIKKQATARHEITRSPMIAEFARATASIPLYQLPSHLAAFPKLWPFPRGDLYHWIPVLNRFDRILELFTQQYGLVDSFQTQPFTRSLLLRGDAEGDDAQQELPTDEILDRVQLPSDGDRELVERILDFTRLLIENCGNRALYNSSDRLDKLLNTTSLSLLLATLRLGLRLAQRYHTARMRMAHHSVSYNLLQSHYAINLDRVRELALPLPKGPAISGPVFATPASKGKDKGERKSESDKISPSDLVGLLALPESRLKHEFGGVSISYYDETLPAVEGGVSKQSHAEAPATPTPVRRSLGTASSQTPRQPHPLSNADPPTTPVTPGFGGDMEGQRPHGPKVYDVSAEVISQTDIHELIQRGFAVLPPSARPSFFHKIRLAKALHTGSAGLEGVVATRLLAIANLVYVLGEKEFYSKIGQQDSDEPRRLQLAYQLAELVHPPGDGTSGQSRELQTLALCTLEALARHKTKAPDVCAALNVNVNHGVLFYLVRKAVAELGVKSTTSEKDEAWREALFSLLNTLPSSQPRTGEGMVSAGLLEILTEVLSLRTEQAERNHPKILQFLDTFVYNLRDAFQALVNAKGLDVLASLTAYEVDVSKSLADQGKGMPAEYKTGLTDYQIPFHHQQTLRWVFKFLNHMLTHTSGTTDRIMRNLIDSPQLLGGLKTVLRNPRTYGSTVWSSSVNILTSFIHNEPTSYAIIAEAGLSEAFLETVSQRTPPDDSRQRTDTTTNSSKLDSELEGIIAVPEAISSLPPAFGAICLAEAGMKLFKSSPALERFFHIFQSPAHVQALDSDSEMATVIGTSFDELVRHHPSLRTSVLSCLNDTISRVVELCSAEAAEHGVGAKLWLESTDGVVFVAGGRKALRTWPGVDNAAAHTGDMDMDSTDENAAQNDRSVRVTVGDVADNEEKSDRATPTQYIRVMCRFLQGFFGNNSMCTAYIEEKGIESILDFANLPCLTPDFDEPRGAGQDFGRVVQILVEQKPHILMPSILKRALRALSRLEPLMDHTGQAAFFAPFTSFDPSEMETALATNSVLQCGTDYVKAFVTLRSLLASLTTTFQGLMFGHRTSHNNLAQVNLADMYARLVHGLGRLHRSCLWEEVLLCKSIPQEWVKHAPFSRSPLGGTSEYEQRAMDSLADLLGPGVAANAGALSEGEVAAGTSDSPASNPGPREQSARFRNTQILRYLLARVSKTITPFFHTLGKLLLYRRALDAYQKQCAYLVSDQLAQAAIDQLLYEPPRESNSLQDKYAYQLVALDSVSQLMIESHSHSLERNTQVLTLMLVSFRNLGGMKVLADMLDAFYTSAAANVNARGDSITEQDRRLFDMSMGGISIILDFYVHIINQKVINESGQTAQIQSQARVDRDRERADYFSVPQFLAELRYDVTQPVQKLWDSELMDSADESIVKNAIAILKTILEGEGEQGALKTTDKFPKRNKPIWKQWKPRTDARIAQLAEDFNGDMLLAREAMYRCCDNVVAARDYCRNVMNGGQNCRNEPPEYETQWRNLSLSPRTAEVVVPGAADDGSDTASNDSEGDEPTAAAASSADAGEAEETRLGDTGYESNWGFLAYRRRMQNGNLAGSVAPADLEEKRNDLRKTLIDRSLDVLNSHEDATFELADLILAAVTRASDSATMRTDVGSTLVQSLISLQTGDNFREQGKRIAASAHLLALVIQDRGFYDAIVGELKDNFDMMLEFIKIFPDQSADESSPWIAPTLAILERLLAEDQVPQQINWNFPTGDEQEALIEDVPQPVVSMDEKMRLLDAILEVLPRIGKDESLALSVTRVLVMLTRTRKIAVRLAEKRNIQRLFLMVRQLAGITNDALRSAFMIVLRHIIEDEEIMREVMGREIQIMFEQRDRRQTDTTAYTRQLHYLAIRDPDLFVQVTNEKLQLKGFDPHQRPQNLLLKKREDAEPVLQDGTVAVPSENTREAASSSTDNPKTPVLERTKTSELKPPVVENPDGVIHYLLCELLAYKDVDDNMNLAKDSASAKVPVREASTSTSAEETPPPDPASPSEPSTAEKMEFKSEAHPIYIYRCFILKCLAELLQSYNRTKIEFINFSRKADPHASTPSKPRSGVLNYLLNALVPVGTLNHEGDLAFKKKLATSGCAIDVIVALCAKVYEPKQPSDQTSPYLETDLDLLFVRKFVLEHALKAFRDASISDEPLDLKYSRLLNIADIFSKMVSQRPDGSLVSPNSELTPSMKQMAKIMYEKNFITVLTTAIADIDLNFPNAKRAVKYILKPLKWLSSVAVDLSTRYDSSAAPGSVDEYEISSASDDDLVGATREETPDLFRNSTLGMYEPGQESESEDEDDEGDEEMYDEAFADDMEYDEDMDDEDVVSEEDEEMGDMGPIEGLPGDAVDVEVVLEDDGDHMISGDEMDSDEEEDEDEDEEDDEEDDDDEMDEMDEFDDMDDMEEVTGDDENASLGDDGEESWDGDHGSAQLDVPIPGHMVPPGTLWTNANTEEGLHIQNSDDAQRIRNLDNAYLDEFLEDEMPEDEDEEEDEDDYDEEEIVYHPGLEDDEDQFGGLAFGWDDTAFPPARHAHRLSPWMFPAGPAGRILVPTEYRSNRLGANARATEDGTNPLLQRAGRSSARGMDSSFPIYPAAGGGLLQALEIRGPRAFPPGESPMSFITNLLNAMREMEGGGPFQFTFDNGVVGIPMPFAPPSVRDTTRAREAVSTRSAREDPHSAISFPKCSTSTRWQQEARILYGSAAIEKAQRVINSILRVMVPPAIEAAKKRQAEKEAEAARKLKEEQERKEQREREEREAKQAKEREEREQREQQEREAAAGRAAMAVSGEAADQESAGAAEGQAMEGVEQAQPSADQAAGSSARVSSIATFEGREIDIGALGIDLEYLNALPEEFREEVLIQQITEHRRRQQSQPDTAPTDIDPEFLEALPPNIRDEVLHQEAQERRRREREEARQRSSAAGAARAEEMDPASFLATLDPNLRQAILWEQDEDTLQHLPPEIVAEARAHGDHRRLNQFPGEFVRDDRRIRGDEPIQRRKARPCVQMLDKSGVATLLRLMFIPQQGSAKASLSHILRNVCENRQNRAEVISILLSILQDGSADVNAVERSFAQLSLRAKQPQQGSEKPAKTPRKTGPLSINPDISPMMVVQQCLHALWQLTDKNPHVWSFFLTEHETAVGFKNRGNRKGKSKENKATRYPLNALLGLLDRKLIIESSSIMEQLTTLLRVITGPLQVLKREQTDAAEPEAPSSSEGQPSAEPPVAQEAPLASEDIDMHSASEPSRAPIEEGNASHAGALTNTGEGSASKAEEISGEDDKSKKHRTLVPPEVPEQNLRLVARILAARECNSKVFQETLSIINNLSPIPGAKETFGKELLGIAQDLARSTLADLADLTLQVSRAETPTDVQGMALAKFSPPSSDQAKLLRVLTALDYLFDPARDGKDKEDGKPTHTLAPTQKEDILMTLYESSTFAGLWQKLSECLSVIRQRGNMLNIATILLPLIEALMVVCKNTTLKDAPLSKMLPKEFALSSPPPENRMESLFFTFTEEHRKILNDLVRQNPKLMSGTFSLLVKNSKVLEFDNKRNYFSRKLHARGPHQDRHPHPSLQLAIRRDHVFMDSFQSLYFKTADEIKYGKLNIRFHGEEGVDAGGVTREWFQAIARQMFNPDYALFVPVASDRTTFHPNRLSAINDQHLVFFKFIGRIIGKALYEGRVLDCHFSRAVYKRILGRPVNLKDMETLDLDYYKSLQWMLENDITDIITETFSIEVEAFGETQIIDLVPDGRNIPVTEENKHEYVRLVTEHRLTGSVHEQLENFLKGFHDIVPAELIAIFSEQELELLISGLPDINVDDWKNNTEYHNYTAASPQIQWFWRAVRSFDKEERAKLLQFVTGTSKVPLNGFKELEGMNGFSKFNIHRDFGAKDRLPSSHTCFNQLDLPEYDSYEDLRKQLYTAMTAGGDYFGFA
ncbi:uncharacterized protein EI97DRAFT_196139 [Westerdykella ornata]|uniref:HECT-type E3 ubiquitin transferase n=1 Tax=Westerdykella ornata TaxID=318751 RepID=A0A6A6J8P0_WESOR|nr:uncharacterized protein EI97DRAFT_196139 [Westerdykella ornata]KAF2272792.1 hypothetical protein EI97DRAFT_196139 [Westerdykella ornata]